MRDIAWVLLFGALAVFAVVTVMGIFK